MLRNTSSIFVLLAITVLACGCNQSVSYTRDVSPILEKNCLSCHRVGQKGYAASGLSMESYDDVMKGTKFGPVIVPGSGLSSTLAILIEHKADPAINMPPEKQRLPEKQIALIKAWIDQGAKYN